MQILINDQGLSGQFVAVLNIKIHEHNYNTSYNYVN